MSQENADVARRSLEGWNDGDVDAWLERAHPDIEWSSSIARLMQGEKTVWRGREALRRFWDEWHAVWDLAIEIAEVRDLGETAVVLGTLRARGRASGAELERPAGWVFNYEDGLVRRAHAYLDWQEALAAAGVPSDP